MFGWGSRWERNRHHFPLYRNQFSPNYCLNCLCLGFPKTDFFLSSSNNPFLSLLSSHPWEKPGLAPACLGILTRALLHQPMRITSAPAPHPHPSDAAAELWLPHLNSRWWPWHTESSWPIFPTLSTFCDPCAKYKVCFPGRLQNTWGFSIVNILEGFKKYWLYFYLEQNLTYCNKRYTVFNLVTIEYLFIYYVMNRKMKRNQLPWLSFFNVCQIWWLSCFYIAMTFWWFCQGLFHGIRLCVLDWLTYDVEDDIVTSGDYSSPTFLYKIFELILFR